MDNLEKLISNLSNYWDLSPEKVVDRLNHMNESEIKNVVNKMTKKFQGGGLFDKIPQGNYMIMSTKTEVLPKKPKVTQAQIDSAYNAEQELSRKRMEQLLPELEQMNANTKQRLDQKRNGQTVKMNPPIQAPITNSNPVYYNGPRPKFEDGGIMKCLKGGKPYSECMKCGGKTKVVKNQEPAGKMKIEPEVEPKGFFKRMFWKPTEYPRVDSYDKFDGDFNGTRSSYYTHDGDLMQILTKKFPAGNTTKTELLIENPHTPLADSTMTITNSNGTDKIRNMRKAKQFLPAFKKNF